MCAALSSSQYCVYIGGAQHAAQMHPTPHGAAPPGGHRRRREAAGGDKDQLEADDMLYIVSRNTPIHQDNSKIKENNVSSIN